MMRRPAFRRRNSSRRRGLLSVGILLCGMIFATFLIISHRHHEADRSGAAAHVESRAKPPRVEPYRTPAAPAETTKTVTPRPTKPSTKPPLHTRIVEYNTPRATQQPRGMDQPQTLAQLVQQFSENLEVTLPEGQNPEQITRDFHDIMEPPGYGIDLPADPTFVEDRSRWMACDPRNAEFTVDRDRLCTEYLSNLNNMASIKPMASLLAFGRTIKFKIFYRHNNIQAIVKLSQKKFFFEAMSELLAFHVDRAINVSRVPTTALVSLPLDYMKAALAYSPFFSQWFNIYVIRYNYTSRNFVPCRYPSAPTPDEAAGVPETLCSLAVAQLWMMDVHSALSTFLGLPFEYDDKFGRKYYTPGHSLWPPRPARFRAIGDLLDRFVFDFLIGNTDRGMNDHNNFAFGGCSHTTACTPRPPEERTLGLAKYAFLDHGSSLYSIKEPRNSPFYGDVANIPICRFRRSTYDNLRQYLEPNEKRPSQPLVTSIRLKLPEGVFRVTSLTVFQKVQSRLEKIVDLVGRCLMKYSEEEVFSIPDYWEISIPEEEELRSRAQAALG